MAATAGFLVLHQALGWAEVLAIGLVVVASVGAVRSAYPHVAFPGPAVGGDLNQ